jgi:hypothetical protein
MEAVEGILATLAPTRFARLHVVSHVCAAMP